MSREVHMKLNADPKTNAFKGVDYEHAEIHAGDHYFFSGHEVEADTGTIEFIIVTPDTTKWAHMTFVIIGTEKLEVDVYEGASGISGGASVTPINNNRNSSNTSGLTVTKDPTSITGDGTLIDSYSVGSTGPFGQIGTAKRDKEIILKQNETYLFRITSNAADNDISYKGSARVEYFTFFYFF